MVFSAAPQILKYSCSNPCSYQDMTFLMIFFHISENFVVGYCKGNLRSSKGCV